MTRDALLRSKREFVFTEHGIRNTLKNQRLLTSSPTGFDELACAPVEDFELDRAFAVVLIDLRGEGEVEFADGKRAVAGAPPDRFVRAGAVGDPHFNVLLFGADALQGALMGQAAGAELHGGISLAGWTQAVEFGEACQGDFVEADFAVEAERRLEVVGFERAAGVVVQAAAEGIEICGGDAQAGGHGVAAVAEEEVVAFAQGGGEVETGDAAAGAAPLLAFTTDDDGRAIKFLEHARGNDPD